MAGNKKPHPLFKSAPQAVQDLSAQAQAEMRQKARREWIAGQQPPGGFRKLPPQTKE